MKKFIGYFIIGATSKKDAFDEKGLLLWSTQRPNAIVRLFNRMLLHVYWVDKSKPLEERGFRKDENTNTQFYKVAPKRDNKYEKPRNNPRRSFKSDRGEA